MTAHREQVKSERVNVASLASLATLASLAFLPALATAQVPEKYHNRVLSIPALAGQSVAVLPLTHLERDSVIAQDSVLGPYLERLGGIRRFDTVFGRFLTENIIDTKWILPDDLRRIYKRNGGAMVPDPDFVGQAALWNPRIEKKVPEPLNSRIRKLVSFTDARTMLVPTGLQFRRDSTGLIGARVGLVLVDARIGDVKWRSYSDGKGPTPDAAVRSALMASLPVDVLAQ